MFETKWPINGVATINQLSFISDFLKFRQCFAKSALETSGRKCNQTYTLEMDKAMDISNSRQVRRELVCRYGSIAVQLNMWRNQWCSANYLGNQISTLFRSTKELMSCVYDVAKTHCGSKAADWMHTVTKHMFSPLLNEIGCKPG